MITNTPMEKYRLESFWAKEPETIEWIKSFSPKSVFYDVGANVGVYSLYAASLYPGTQVYAFEPLEKNFHALLGNRILNKFFNLLPMRFAIGSFVGQCVLDKPFLEAGASGAQMVQFESGNISTITVDAFAACFPKPAYLKVDIDGQEENVIIGAAHTLPGVRSALIEVSSRTKAPIQAMMLSYGFSVKNRFNAMSPHSRERRAAEKIDAENIVFTKK